MRCFPDGYSGGADQVRPSVLWNCQRGLGDSVLRLEVTPASLMQALAHQPLLDVQGENRLTSSFAACCPCEQGPDEEGAWLYGASLALHCQRPPTLMLVTLKSLNDQLPARSLLLFDAEGRLVQVLAPGEHTTVSLDRMIARHLHPRQDCLPELVAHRAYQRAPLARDLNELERAWCHSPTELDFARVLTSRCLSRNAVYEHIGGQYAWPVARETLPSVLALAQERRLPLGVNQVLAHGRQYYRAVPQALSWRGNRLDFCLGASRHEWRLAQLGEIWRVRRPGNRGIQTSLEVLDDRGELALVLDGDCQRSWCHLLRDCLYQPADRGCA